MILDGSKQCSVTVAGAGAGGSAGQVDLWNEYHRVRIQMTVSDTTDSWTYSTAAFQSTNASTTNRVTLFVGVEDEPVTARAYHS
jgi:hypothetical protein